MEKAELVFIPTPGVGHLMSAVEIAKVLLNRDKRLSITVLIINRSTTNKFNSNTVSFPNPSISRRIKFINLPEMEVEQKNPVDTMTKLINGQVPSVRQVVAEFINSNSNPDSPRLAGFVIDMFCTVMIDVANEFGVPTYMFFTSGATYLGFKFHLQYLHDVQNLDPTEYMNSEAELNVPSCVNPVPAKVLPDILLKKEFLEFFLVHTRRSRELKGILVNTFLELESHAVHALSLDGSVPRVYPVGPILNLTDGSYASGCNSSNDIIQWLDDQPPMSVVFLCFGSMGTIIGDQVMEFASALEKCGVRFLWSLRKPHPITSKREPPSEYTTFDGVLPEGFLDRTARLGRVIGWAPQVKILSHKAIGGFVSHCGWNSTLESISFGVPMATLPLYAEQQFNAFSLVKEFGVAVEIKMDYRRGFAMENQDIVSAEVIEKAIKSVMEHDSEVRKKAKEMSEKSQKALEEGGSSYSFLADFVTDVFNNMPPLTKADKNIC